MFKQLELEEEKEQTMNSTSIESDLKDEFAKYFSKEQQKSENIIAFSDKVIEKPRTKQKIEQENELPKQKRVSKFKARRLQQNM